MTKYFGVALIDCCSAICCCLIQRGLVSLPAVNANDASASKSNRRSKTQSNWEQCTAFKKLLNSALKHVKECAIEGRNKNS